MNASLFGILEMHAAMRLTSYTDYALRALMHLARNRDSLITIQDIADRHGIAKNHLSKVIHHMGVLGFVETVRGRNGGLRLAVEPENLRIGALVRETEPDFFIAECFDQEHDTCAYSGNCRLQQSLQQATGAFLAVLDGVTLADVVAGAQAQGMAQGATQFMPLKRAR